MSMVKRINPLKQIIEVDMTEREHMVVFSYDIRRNSTRQRVSSYLEERLVRVQRSVFEGHMTPRHAASLFDTIVRKLDDGDSLRLYIIDQDGAGKSRQHGGAPFPEKEGFILM